MVGLINEFFYKTFAFKIHIVKDIKYKPKGHLWFEREEFKKIYASIKDNTVVDEERCYLLFQLARYVTSLNGELAEVGVYKGGTARLIACASILKNKTLHLFDTFSGLPKVNSEKDTHWQGGEFSDTSFDEVKKYLSDIKNVKIYKGFFPKTADPIQDKIFCFVHIDVDIYQSALDCYEFFYKRLIDGGIMIFDDYGFIGCEGLKGAVDEFSFANDIYPIYLPTGQGMIIKNGKWMLKKSKIRFFN